METKEVVRYGDRNVPLVITEIADAEAITEAKAAYDNKKDKFKPDCSLVDEYAKLGLHNQVEVAKKEAEEKARKARREAKTELIKRLSFRLLSKAEALEIGRYYANKVKKLDWRRGRSICYENFGGITEGLEAFTSEAEYKCNPWTTLEYMDTELIPLRIAQALKTMRPLFDNISIASIGQVEKSMSRTITRRYQDPVAVGIAGNDIALLARWGDYPKFLDSINGIKEPTTLQNFFWKLNDKLGRLFGQKRQEQE